MPARPTRQNGFTLIELMIVLAILGILMAIAIPAYSDYAIRSKISEAVNVAASPKAAVSETTLSSGVFPTNNAEAGIATGVEAEFVARLDVIADGVIEVELRGIDVMVDGTTILFVPTRATGGGLDWACNPGTINSRFLPQTCRN